MKVTNLDDVLKSLDEATATIERKLKAVVKGYALDAVDILVRNTPYGSLTFNGKPNEWYSRRSEEAAFGSRVDEVPGTARNNWRIALIERGFSGIVSNETLRGATPTGVPFDFPSGSETGEVSFSNVRQGINSYQLGDFVVLWNNAPYINRRTLDWSGKQGLEQGSSSQAPTGIRQPSIDEIKAMYSAGANIKSHFDGG